MLLNHNSNLEVIEPKPASRTIEDICRDIENLDLEMIKFKLTDKRDHYRWTRAFADEIEIEYKRFMILGIKYPEANVVPGLAVDIFWHQHILDTKKYTEDCLRIFGFFVHHYPYLGMLGDEDEEHADKKRKLTHSLYEREFGEKRWEERQKPESSQRKKTKAPQKIKAKGR